MPRSLLAKILAEKTGAVSLPLPLPLVYPALWALAGGLEAAAALFQGRPRFTRRMLRVYLRPRSYDIRPACEDLVYEPAATAEEFSRAVASCLAGFVEKPSGEHKAAQK